MYKWGMTHNLDKGLLANKIENIKEQCTHDFSLHLTFVLVTV